MLTYEEPCAEGTLGSHCALLMITFDIESGLPVSAHGMLNIPGLEMRRWRHEICYHDETCEASYRDDVAHSVREDWRDLMDYFYARFPDRLI